MLDVDILSTGKKHQDIKDIISYRELHNFVDNL